MHARKSLAGVICALGLAASPAAAQTSPCSDTLLRYAPDYSGGCLPTNANFIDPMAAVGMPDYSGGGNGTGAVSLGSGGLIEVEFTTSQIVNSGDANPDLRVVEVGGYSEAFMVYVRPAPPTTPEVLLALGLKDTNGDGFFYIGRTEDTGGGIDIDARFNQIVPALGVRFDAVQVLDDMADTPSCTTTPGADIDAVVALKYVVAIEAHTWTRVKSIYRD